jgi:hypothetical protein
MQWPFFIYSAQRRHMPLLRDGVLGPMRDDGLVKNI